MFRGDVAAPPLPRTTVLTGRSEEEPSRRPRDVWCPPRWDERDADEYVDDMSAAALTLEATAARPGRQPTAAATGSSLGASLFPADADAPPPPPPRFCCGKQDARKKLRAHIWAAAAELQAAPDVWEKHQLETCPARRVRRHRYDAVAMEWRVDESLAKVADAVFDEGAMRRCYRAKKLSFGYVKRFHALEWKKAPNFVVKEHPRPRRNLPMCRSPRNVPRRRRGGVESPAW